MCSFYNSWTHRDVRHEIFNFDQRFDASWWSSWTISMFELTRTLHLWSSPSKILDELLHSPTCLQWISRGVDLLSLLMNCPPIISISYKLPKWFRHTVSDRPPIVLSGLLGVSISNSSRVFSCFLLLPFSSLAPFVMAFEIVDDHFSALRPYFPHVLQLSWAHCFASSQCPWISFSVCHPLPFHALESYAMWAGLPPNDLCGQFLHTSGPFAPTSMTIGSAFCRSSDVLAHAVVVLQRRSVQNQLLLHHAFGIWVMLLLSDVVRQNSRGALFFDTCRPDTCSRQGHGEMRWRAGKWNTQGKYARSGPQVVLPRLMPGLPGSWLVRFFEGAGSGAAEVIKDLSTSWTQRSTLEDPLSSIRTFSSAFQQWKSLRFERRNLWHVRQGHCAHNSGNCCNWCKRCGLRTQELDLWLVPQMLWKSSCKRRHFVRHVRARTVALCAHRANLLA